jgi:hypothetical protein
VEIDGEYELDDELGLDAQLDALFSSANLKQDLMRFRPPTASVFESSNIPSEVARIVFFLEDYARAARLSELHRRWRGYLQQNKQNRVDLFNEIELIAKRVLPSRTWRFSGRETLKLWEPLVAWL